MKLLIVDNEPEIRKGIKSLLEFYCPQITHIFEANGVQEGISSMAKNQPDILITDVEMGDGTGIEMLSLIPNLAIPVIFITAYNQYAVDAFRLSAIDFLMKPIDTSELIKAVSKALDNINTKNSLLQLAYLKEILNKKSAEKKIILKDTENIYFVDLKDIIYCQADGNYTLFVTSQGQKILISKSIGEYESLFENDGFIRSHHSFLVNQSHIKSFSKNDGGILIMSNGTEIAVSQRKKEKILALLFN